METTAYWRVLFGRFSPAEVGEEEFDLLEQFFSLCHWVLNSGLTSVKDLRRLGKWYRET